MIVGICFMTGQSPLDVYPIFQYWENSAKLPIQEMLFVISYVRFQKNGKGEKNMSIQFRYEPTNDYTDGRIEVFANKASIGYLISYMPSPNLLNWLPCDGVYSAKFQFRKEETFMEVVRELRRYKEEKGYEYLTIWTFNNGLAYQLDKDMLNRAGFANIPGNHPACMFLK